MRDFCFAGSFYPGSKKELENTVKSYLSIEVPKEKDKIKAMIVPHAGYVYSGSTAALAYKSVSMQGNGYDSAIIIGPNHTGIGDPIGISASDWATPLGIVKNDTAFGEAIAKASDMASIDELSHIEEHSIEVQLPMLQCSLPDIPIVPICLGNQSLAACKDIYNSISKAEKSLGRHPLVIASSDFNHYESEAIAKSKDMPLIRMLEGLKAAEFNDGVIASEDSSCGYGASTIAALYARSHGAKMGKLLEYTNSGKKTGDLLSVVAYASIIFL